MIGEMWRNHWERFIPFFAFRAEIRKIDHTTNSIEAVNRQLRKIIKTRGHFPTDDAALKLLWLALMRAEKKWTHDRTDSTPQPSWSATRCTAP
jgi:putative transposase